MKLDVPALLRRVVRAKSLAVLGSEITREAAASRSIVLVRVWFTAQDGLLTLVSSAGTPSGGGSYARLDGEFREMAVADATIGQIASSGEPFVVRGVRGDEEWLTNSAWAARQGVRAFLAFPMMAHDSVIGILAAFDREMPDPDLLSNLALVADIAAHRAADLGSRPAASTSVPPGNLRPPDEGRRFPGGTEVLTRAELRRIEKGNIEAALARTQGKVFGSDGAAALLGMRPTTLASRVKALGIRRGDFRATDRPGVPNSLR